MANQFLNAVEYANTMLLLVKNNLVTAKLVDGRYENKVTDENGLAISIKRPARFIDKKSGTSAALALQDVINGRITVQVDQYSKVHISVGDIEYVQSFNDLVRNSTFRSAAQTLSHSIDSYLQTMTLGFSSWVGTPGEDFKSPAQFNPMHTRLMELGVPDTDLGATVTYSDQEKITAAMPNLFLPTDMNRSALEKGRLPILVNIDAYATQQTPTLITGTRVTSGAAQVDGAAENVNYRTVANTMQQSLSVKGLVAAQTIKAGEVFSIAGVYAYDWRSHQVLPWLQQFTVVTNHTVVGTTAELTITPAIIVPGTTDGVSTDANTAFGTVGSIPADSAAITWLGAANTPYKQRAAWHKQAIAMVSAKLQSPFTGTFAFARDPESGISIRYWRGSDISTGAHIHRWDCIYGAICTDPLLGTRGNGLAA